MIFILQNEAQWLTEVKSPAQIHIGNKYRIQTRSLHLKLHIHLLPLPNLKKGFPACASGKEPACNAEDPGLIPGSERSTGEGIG